MHQCNQESAPRQVRAEMQRQIWAEIQQFECYQESAPGPVCECLIGRFGQRYRLSVR